MRCKSSLLFVCAIPFTVAACGAEDSPDPTRFAVTIENVSGVYDFGRTGVFSTPTGAREPGPLMPGRSYQASFYAGPGERLSFATMFVQSNDFFFATPEAGIALFAEGAPLEGDITEMIQLWDAGTEINQEPGAGADQAPHQSGPNQGAADADSAVRMAADDFGNLPGATDVLQVSLVAEAGNRFTLTIENVSEESTLMFTGGESLVFLAPGVWAVHGESAQLFQAGEAAPVGLEALAQDGDPSGLAEDLAARTGLTGPIAPGVFAVHTAGDVLFEAGSADRGLGLEGLAEDGSPRRGNPISGDVTASIALWDAGTEVNEFPGAGPNQAPRQSGPNTGEDEGGVVMLVDDDWSYPEVPEYLKVTINAPQLSVVRLETHRLAPRGASLILWARARLPQSRVNRGIVLVFSACMESQAEVCEGGLICPSDSECTEEGTCGLTACGSQRV
jgi:hypothetical protein